MAIESLTYNQFEIVSNEDSTSVDLRAGAPLLEYRESVFTPYVMVTCAIVDTGASVRKNNKFVSTLEGIKCQGGEKVFLSMTDNKGNKIDLSDDDSLRVAVVNNINETFRTQSFTMTLFSPEYIENLDISNYCYELYSGRVSDIIRQVVTKNLQSEKQFVSIDDTKNEISLHGLAMEPFDFLTECQRLGVPNESGGSGSNNKMAGYLFWQTSDGFNFKSLDRIFKISGSYLNYSDSRGRRIKHYVEAFSPNRLPVGFDDQIIHTSFNRTIDIVAQFQSGGYAAQLETMDHVTSTWNGDTQINATGEGDRIIAGKLLPNLGEYSDRITTKISATKAKGQTTTIADNVEKQVEKTDKEKYNVDEVALQAMQNYRQKMNFSAQIIIPGDFSLHAGDLVYCEFRELSDDKFTLSSRDRNSGIYMIADLCHFGNKTKTFTGLHLVRDSYGVKQSDG